MILDRQAQAPYAPPQHTTPPSVVWLRRATTGWLLLLAFLLAYASFKALAQSRWFVIDRIVMQGDTQFHGALTLRANVLPHLTGNYFTLDLRQAQKSFEALPWIRSATVQRVFPNQLKVRLVAHTPVARWGVLHGERDLETTDIERLVNHQGELFDASGGAMDTEALPLLSGPDDQAAEIWTTYLALKRLMAFHKMALTELALNAQGNWQASLANGAELMLGGGTGVQAMGRTTQWLAHWPAVQKKLNAAGRDVQSVDLRYSQGFAVRIQGVTTR